VVGEHADGVLRVVRRSLQVLLCALAAHAAAYGSLVPNDSLHGYMGAYEAVVAGLSAAALGIFLFALLALLAGRERLLLALVGRRALAPFGHGVTVLGCSAFAVLVAQESLERSVQTGTIGLAGAPLAIVLNAVVATVAVATVFTLLERSCAVLIRALLVRRGGLPRAPGRTPVPRSAPRLRRRNPLAELRGLRAPPALTG
jgi:hypothetical protein